MYKYDRGGGRNLIVLGEESRFRAGGGTDRIGYGTSILGSQDSGRSEWRGDRADNIMVAVHWLR